MCRVCGEGTTSVRLLEKTELELCAQHAKHRTVDHRFRHQACAHRFPIVAVLRPRGLEDDVEPRLPRVFRGGGRIGLGHVEHRGAACRCSVGDHEALKSPVSLEDVGHEPPVLRGRRTIDRVVRGHDRSRACVFHRGLERREVQLVELPRAQVDRVTVTAAVTDVGHEVLWRRNDTCALERADERVPEQRREEWIFAVRLLDASPTHVGRDVHDRRQRLPDPSFPRFLRRRSKDVACQHGVPRGRQPDGLGKHGGAGRGQPVQRLLERNDRDA